MGILLFPELYLICHHDMFYILDDRSEKRPNSYISALLHLVSILDKSIIFLIQICTVAGRLHEPWCRLLFVCLQHEAYVKLF